MKMQAVEVLLPVPRAVSAALIVLYVPPVPAVKHPLGGLVRAALLASSKLGTAHTMALRPRSPENNLDEEMNIVKAQTDNYERCLQLGLVKSKATMKHSREQPYL
jgi:hypothetical protein